MNPIRVTRRSFLTRSTAATVAAGSFHFWTAEARAAMPMPVASGSSADAALHTLIDTLIDTYIAAYMPAMNAPGMTLGLTDAKATLRTAGYGYANIDLKTPVATSHLFQIGSITKSFVALVLMQLRDEGKLDVQKPILDYLPWLPIREEYGPITVHHLLTHSSGLPDNLGIFPSDPSARLVQGFTPGEHFYYCNAGFDILGELVVHLDNRPWRAAVQARILTPLGMNSTLGVIPTSSRDRFAVGYQPYWDDRVYPRQGRLAVAPNLAMDDTAGCIGSTPGDMANYLRMLLNRGQGPSGRLVSEDSFALFSTPHIKAEEFSPTASYGYGIAVDTLDGHKILWHTGGMVAFASAMHVDLDGGVAAFASINAMQGYRPTAVTQHAVRLLRAAAESKPLPAAPPIANPAEIDNAADYAGAFTAPHGRKLVFLAKDKSLYLAPQESPDGKPLPPIQLERAGGDSFIVSVAEGEYARSSFDFARLITPTPTPATPTPAPAAAPPAAIPTPEPAKPKPPVVEVSFGDAWFAGAAYAGPRTFTVPESYAQFVGTYRCDSPWAGQVRVYVLKDRLMLSGAALTPLGGNLFRTGDDPWSPETAEFLYPAGGRTRLLKSSGFDFWRIDVE